MAATVDEDQAVKDLTAGGDAGLVEIGKMQEEKEKETLTNGDVETIGVQESGVSESGDATASSKEEDAKEATPEAEGDKSGEVKSELKTLATEDEQRTIVDEAGSVDKRVEDDRKEQQVDDEREEKKVDGDREEKQVVDEEEEKQVVDEEEEKQVVDEGEEKEVVDDGEGKNADKEKEEVEEPDWIDILGTGHLKKKVLREGQGTDTRPERGQLVTVKSKGVLPSGEEVDCYEEIQFVLGDGDVVQAWDLSVTLMQLGEQAIVKTTPRFAYGEVGRPGDIPPNTDITYELELLKVENKPDPETLSPEDCCQMADKKRERGNELYSRKDYSNAMNSYSKALDILRGIKPSSLSEDSKKAVDELKVKCYNNLAAAQLKVDAQSAALKSCNAVLEVQPKNVKALFRKGKVLAAQGEYKEAVTVMKEALSLEPANKTIHQELSKLTARQAEQKQSEKELYQRMVGDMAKTPEEPEDQPKRQWIYAISVGVLAAAVLVGAIFASQT